MIIPLYFITGQGINQFIMRSIIFLLLFLRYSWSLPSQQVSNDDSSAEGSFFNPGSSYNYSIEFEVSTGFIALPKEKSGNISVKGECLAGLDIYPSCLGRFKLYNCNFLQRAQKFDDENLNYIPFDGLTTFGQNLEKNPIYFKYDADQINSIHYEHTLNDGALLNFQKSLLSTLFLKKNINALTEQIIYESDVFGKCPSQYDIVGDELVASLSKDDSFQQVTNSQAGNDVILKRLKHIQMCINPNSPVKYWFYNELAFEPKQECFYVIRDLSKLAKITCEEEYAVPITGTLTLVRTNFTLMNVGTSILEEPFDLKIKNQGSIAYKPIANYSAPQIGNLEILDILKKSVPSSEVVDDKFLSVAAHEYERLLDYLKSQDDSNNIMSVWGEIQKLQNHDKIEEYLKDILLECYQPGCAQAKFLILKSQYDASFDHKVISSMGLHETAPDTLPLILEWCKRHESTHCLIALGNGLTFVNKESSDMPKPAPETIERVFAYIHSQIPADCRAKDNLLLDNAVISLHHAITLATNYSKLMDLHQSLEHCVQVHKLHYPVLASNALHVLENIPKIRETHLNQLMLEVIEDPDQITSNKLQAFIVLLARNSSDLNQAIDIYINVNERIQLKSFVSSLLLLDQRYNFNYDILTIFRQKLYEKDYVPDMKPRYPFTNSHAFLIKHPLELSFIKTQDLEILSSIIYDQRSYLPSDIQLEFMLKRDGGRISLYAGITSAGPFLEKVVNELWNSKNLFFDAEKLEIHELLDPFKSIYQTLQVLVKTYLPLNSLPPIENIMEKLSKNKEFSQVLKDLISIANKNRQKNDLQQNTIKPTKNPDARFYITTVERMITYEPLEKLVDAFLSTIKTKSLIDVLYKNLKDNHIINWFSKLDIDHVLPTICGIPLKILARVKLGYYLKSLITKTESWQFDGRRFAHLDSAISMEIFNYWSGVLKTSLRKENNIKFDAKITSTKGKLNLDFEIPKSNYKTYNYDKDHAVVVNGQIFKMEKVDGKTIRQTPVYCDSKVMALILGFENCRQTSRLLYDSYGPYFARSISVSADLVSEETWLKPIGSQSTTLTITYQVKRRPSWNPFNYDNYYFSNIGITISNNQSKIEIDRTYEPDTFWKLLITANGGKGYKAHLKALLSPPDKKLVVKLNGPDSYHNQYLSIQDKDVTHQNSVEGTAITKQFTFIFHESDRSDWNITADRLVTPSKLILKSTLTKRCNSFVCNILFPRKPPNTTSISHFNVNYTLKRTTSESILHILDLIADIEGKRNLSASLTYDFAQTTRAFNVLSLYNKYPMAFTYKWRSVPTIKNPINDISILNHHQFSLNSPHFKDSADIKFSRGNKEFIMEFVVSHLFIPSMSESFKIRFLNVIKKDVNHTHQSYFGKVFYNMSSPHIHFTSQWEFQNNETHSDLLINCSDEYFNFGESYPSHTGKTNVWLNAKHDPLDLGYDVSYKSAENKLRLNGKSLNDPIDTKYSRKDEWISTIPGEALLNFDYSCITNSQKNELDQSCRTYNYFDNATFFLNVIYKDGLAFKMTKIWTANSNQLIWLSSGIFSIVIADNKGHINWTISNLGVMEGQIFHTDKGLKAILFFNPKTSSYGINSMKAASLELALCGKRGLSYNITIYRRFRQIFAAYFTNMYQEINQIVFSLHPYLSLMRQYQTSPRFRTFPSDTYDWQGYYIKPLPGIWLRNRLDYMLFAILDIPSSVLYATVPWSEHLMERERFLSLVYTYFGKIRSAPSEPLLVPDTKSFFVHHPFYWTEFGKAPEITFSSLSTYIAQRSDVSVKSLGYEVPRDALYTYASIFEDKLITFDGVFKTLPKSPSACSHLLAHDGHSNRFSLMLLNDLSLLLYTQEWDLKISFLAKDCSELRNFTCSRSISITLNDEIITFLPYLKEGRTKNSGSIAIYFDEEKLNINLPGIRLACEAHPQYSHEEDTPKEHLLSCLFGLSPIYHANILGSLANNDLEPSNDLAGGLEKFSICPTIDGVEQKNSLVNYKEEKLGTGDITWDFKACFSLYRWNYWSDLYDCFGLVDPTPYFYECRSHYDGTVEDKNRIPPNNKLACQVIRQYQSMCNFRGITIDSLDTCDHKDFTLFPPYTSPSVSNTKFDVIFLLDRPLSPDYIDLIQTVEKEMAISLEKVFNSGIDVKYGLLSPYKLSDEWNFVIKEPRVELLPKSRENAMLLDTIVFKDAKDSQVQTKIKNGRTTKYKGQQLFAKALSLYKSRPDTTRIFVSISNDSIKLQSNKINFPFYYYQHLFWDKKILYITVNPDRKQIVNKESIILGYPFNENLEITLNKLKNKNKYCRVCLPSEVKYAKDSMECSYYPMYIKDE